MTETTPGAEEAVKPELTTIKVNGRELKLTSAELVQRAQLGVAAEDLVQKKKDFVAERQTLGEAETFLAAAKDDPGMAGALDQMYLAIQNKGPRPSFLDEKPAAAPNQVTPAVGEAEGVGEAGGNEATGVTAKALHEAAQARRIDDLERRLTTRDSADTERVRAQLLSQTIDSSPLVQETPASRSLVENLARQAIGKDPSLPPQDAVALASTEIRDYETKKTDTERKRREDGLVYQAPQAGGSPFSKPDKPFTEKDMKDGSMKKAIKTRLAQLANPQP